MPRAVRSHMVNLVLCLVTTVIGTGFVIAGLMNDGAETRRLLQCVSPERADLVVLPVTLPGDLSAPRPPLGALADLESISGVDAVREVGGGVLRTVAPGPSSRSSRSRRRAWRCCR
ncbi:hypothetical protein ACFQYP_40945 [Nonomuraea antimicrobica]